MDNVPVLTLMEQKERLKELTVIAVEKHFKNKYDYLPTFYVRVPGRVNLIGEHIDYCGFSVMPMAIELDITLAVGINKDKMLKLSNVDSDKYEDFSCPIGSMDVDPNNPKWYHYFICGLRGIVEECDLTPKGLDVVVKGTIPPGSGLSSSSALVCAAALATSYANRTPLRKVTIATICAVSERFIGTLGGGMDQAIAFLAEAGTAKNIHFHPLRTLDVHLPADATFIIANSCVSAHKALTSDFNIRSIECRIACKVMARHYNLRVTDVFKLKEVADIMEYSLEKMAEEVCTVLHEEPYTKVELCELLNADDKEFKAYFLNDSTSHLTSFKLRQRALHVFQEAVRVENFKKICEDPPNDALEKLGQLMNESHASCRDLFECSHPDLDDLVSIAVNAGALGSRLTGAGWGGCCVSLVPSDNIAKFVQEVRWKYYMKSPDRSKNWPSAVFTSKPGGGATVFTV